MDVDIPPSLQWVSYLAGGAWPQGSESGMARIQEFLAHAAEQLDELIPELNRVRGETHSVLMGETALAALEQFAMLFDGDYAVDKLSDAVRALAETSGYTGSEIEYSKLSIVFGLALAAAEISYALAMSAPTWGASTAAIPAIEWATIFTFRQLVAALLRRLAAQVRETLARTTVRRLVYEGFQEAGQELAIAGTQEGLVYATQGDNYRVNSERLLLNGIASTVGGGAGGVTAVPTANFLGPAASRLGAAGKGATTFFTAGVVGNLAGTASVGGEFDPFMIMVSSTTSSVGGLGGAGVAPGTGGNNSNGQQSGTQPPDTGSAPEGDLPPVGPDDGDSGTAEPDDEAAPVNGQDPNSVNGAPVAEPNNSQSATQATADTNSAATQDDPTTAAATQTADDQSAVDSTTQADPQSTHAGDTTDTPPQTQEGATLTGADTGGDHSSSTPSQGLPVADSAPDPSANGQPVAGTPADAAPSTVSDAGPESGPESVVAAPTSDPSSATTPTIADTGAPTDTPLVADPQSQPQASPAANQSSVGPSVVPNTQTPTSSAPSTPSPSTPTTTPSTPTTATSTPATTTPKPTAQQDVPQAPKATASTSETTATPVARAFDTAPKAAQQGTQKDDSEQPVRRPDVVDDGQGRTEPVDCLDKIAEKLSAKLGRPIRLGGFPSPQGRPAIHLFQALQGSSEFADYNQVRNVLGDMESGSFAILTSAWAGGPNRGGHAYLAFNENGQVRFEDAFSDQSPQWDEGQVLRTAAGFFHADGTARDTLRDVRQLVPAAAIGDVAGDPIDDGGSSSSDSAPGERWRDVVPQNMVADSALARRVPPVETAEQLRNPLGLMEAASARARDNANWWADLTGAEQRALIDTYPHHIGNAEGIPATARHEANSRSLEQDRRELQARRGRGERLTRDQRKQLARLDRISEQLAEAGNLAQQAEVGGPLLLAFDPLSFGGDGRAVVSFGADPYSAESVSWHVPGLKMNIDQLGPCMGDAFKHLQSTLQENPTLKATSIAWIGYDTPSGVLGAARHDAAREGAAILYSDIRAFNAARDTWAGDGSHFSGNHVFAHSYGSTTASYAGRDGRLANDVRTVTLIGSPGAGPVQRAAEFGDKVDVYVASSSRDPVAGLGARVFDAAGRIFGVNLGIDPAMDSFGAQRITAEFSAGMDRRRNWGTHLAYYKFVDRTANPPVRTESLANFGRIAAGHPDRLDLESHRTIEDRNLRRPHVRTIEPAAGRPLRLDGDTEQSGDRRTRRLWNPRWRTQPTDVDPSHVDDDAPTPDESPAVPADEVAAPTQLDPEVAKQIADVLLEERGIAADDLMSPADHRVAVQDAVARSRENGLWWKGLSETQKLAMIQAYPHQVGNSEGIPPMARHAANSLMLQSYLAERDVLVSQRENGVGLNADQVRFIDLMNDVESALRSAERNTQRANVGGPYLLALDPDAFDGHGRAIVSFGENPYTAQSVSWYVPGMTTTIEKLRPMMLRAFNQLQSTLRESPGLSAASITYIGYKAPGSWDPKVISQQMAREGGEIFCSDMLSFNAGRDVFHGDGSHFSGNHVFAHSYGSSTVSHAGYGRRLGGEVQTITLIGSPGAGPLRHARDFGIGADNVFVAASSRDQTTGLGGERPGEKGRRVRSLGQGMDPAMDSFGAQRITAEFPAALDHLGRGSRMTHSLYWAYMDPGVNPQVRSESLVNFGRIAAGHSDRVDIEGHRTLGERARFLRSPGIGTVEPAIGRPLRLVDDPAADHPVNRRRPWNPRFRNLPAESIESPPIDVDEGPLELDEDIPSPAKLQGADVEQMPAPAKVVADVELKARGITADDMMSPADHKVPVAEAVARAKANAQWWQGLSENQQQALIQAYPHQVGNAEGIPPMARHQANSLMLQRYLGYRDLLVSRRDNGVALNRRQERFLDLMNTIEDGMRVTQRNTDRAGVGGPYLLALDPRAFNGVGRAIISFGADPYTADSVSWYVPGISTTIEKVGTMMRRGFNILQSTLQENPTLNAASITYLGYKPPASWDIRALSQRMAREGGQIFCSDVVSFNAGRDIFAGDGSHFSGHHIFAHSYGSSTVSHAGGGRRLAGQVQTITLIGSPGAGPLRHAGDFGIGADNVFVAASSRDKTTGLGGERAGEKGRIIRFLGQGMDPAMDSFGAQRITAEFPAALDRTESGSRMTHSLYWAYMDPGVNPQVRSESLANFGRIAAGHSDRVDIEGHRTLGERARLLRKPAEDTIEPAIGRPLRLADDPVTHRPVNRRNYWNPNFLRDANCAFLVAQELSSMYGRDFTLAVDPSPRGVAAFRLFEAVGSSSRFATYADVETRLRQLGPGSSAVLASRWRGRGQSGHAFLAVNDGGQIYLVDPHSGERSGWPPPWSEDAVRRTAVGYLDADGVPVNRYDGAARQLSAAGFIGRVQGLPGTSAAADTALAQRVPQVPAEELVNPVGSADLAVERARANAEWWAGLSDTQRQDLIETYPLRIGNAEGIPATDRDIANRRVLQHYRDRADAVRTKLDEFVLPSREDRAFLQRVNRIDAALNKADADAQRAGVEAPLLLAFDPAAFDGDGRAVISFGDPYTAETVSWHTGSVPIDKLGTVVRPALDELQAIRQESPSAAVIAWVGDNKGTSALHSDLAAFHAAREALATTTGTEPFTGNRVHTMRSPSTSLWVPRDTGSQVVAHRGASHEFPEQTLAAYREALRQGARGLECDVRLTKDGHLVCIHDKRVDRTSNGSGNVGDMTLAELQELDFGGWHPSRELGDTRSDTGILTLEQLLQLVAAHDQPVTLFIETKHPDKGGWKLEREVVALLERYGMANPESPKQARAAVISFYPDALWRVRRAAPNLPTVLLGPAARYLAGAVGATGIGPSIKMLRANPELVDAAAARGMTTYCWTVNDQNDVQYARDLGVGWIATDHPGQTGTLLQSEPTAPAAQDPPTPTTETPASPDPDATAAVAEAALAQRVPPVRPDELRNPFGVTEEAVARAQNNASWWEGLTAEQRLALIETHPQHIGNAEGILATDRDAANRIVLQQLRNQADTVQSKIDDGKRTSAEERKFLQRVNRLEDALRKAGADAENAGESGPLLLAFDPAEFGGDGRAVLSFGDDPYQADSVSWHAPGIRTTIHSLFGFSARSALNHLQSTRLENPTQKAASIAWIGYDTPSGLGLGRMLRQTGARAGGDILYSDIRAFNAGRDAWAGDGSHFTGNHIFGYSYGSTTTAHAGRDGRLANHVRTISLVGSPGAGPLQHASEFGQGVDVYVASSSRDVITAQGGRTPGAVSRILGPVGRFFGIGLGVDPAMDSFGAVRVTAEFPGARNLLHTGGTHHAYLLHMDSTGDVRSESLANLGRISAGQIERLELEQHRTTDGRRTVEPAAERAGPRRFWNPSWGRVPNCAQLVATELSSIYGRDIRLAVTPSRSGVPARALFEAIGANADFTTYADVANTLQHMPEGSTAVLVSRWSGGRQGGHAYLARNIDGDIQLIDPHTGQRSGWPPHWGQDAVARAAVGYLDANGRPVDRISVDIPLRLDAADAVGRVKGVPADHDFARRQADYRAQDPVTRRVDTRYAEPLGDVVDNVDAQQVRQLAADLSGMYGPYRVQLRADVRGIEVTGEVILGGEILSGDQRIGHVRRTFIRDFNGDLVARHDVLEIEDGAYKFKGFSTAFIAELERFYVHAGVNRIELTTDEDGGVVWARRGFTWNPDPSKLQESFDQIRESARLLRASVSVEAQGLLDQYMQRLDSTNAKLPEPIELANLATPAEPNLGRDLLTGTKWHAVRHLPTADATTKSRSGFGAWLKRTLGWGVDRDPNCAHVVADELSALYGREFRVVSPQAPTGVPAWALFEAVGSGAEFATYDEIASTLRELGDGSSAVLASRWSTGRQGGHAYLAINDGGEVQLYDPHTRQRSGWPPHWGQDAVSRTAVGYLDTEGNPVNPLHHVPLQLAAADAIGDVKGPIDDSNFSRDQADYRRQDPRTRLAQARYAEPVGEVLASADPDRADQLAEDLSGVYGPCRIEMTQEHFEPGDIAAQLDAIAQGIPTFGPSIYGDVLFENQYVGTIHFWIKQDKLGVFTVEHQLFVQGDYPVREFTDAVARELEPYLQRSGAVRMDSTTSGKAAYAAAARGEAWNPDPELLAQSLLEVKRSAAELWPLASDAARGVLNEVMTRLDPDGTDIPTPIELAALAAPDQPHLGRQLLEGTGIHDPDYDDILSETQLHTVNVLRGDGPTWLATDAPTASLPDPVLGQFDPSPADTNVPVDEARRDPNFPNRQHDYRLDDPATRRVEPTYADPLGIVVDIGSPSAVAHVAADLTGVYGVYRVEFAVSAMQDYASGRVQLTGEILRGDEVVGGIGTTFYRDIYGHLVVDNAIAIDSADDAFEDVAGEIDSALEPYYWRSGVHRIEEEVVDDTGRTAVARGYTWNPDPAKLAESVDNMTQAARALGREVGPEARAALRDLVTRLHPTQPDLPTPADLGSLSVASEPELGARLLADTNWWAVKYRPATETSAHVAPRSDVDLDFVSRQAEYRTKLPSTRQVEAHYAQPIGDVVDSAAPHAAAQLGEDLTGQYGPYGIEFEGRLDSAGRVVLEGDIVNGDVEIGAVAFTFERDDADDLTVLHELHITGDLTDGADASQRLIAELAPSFIASGIDRIVSTTHGQTTLAAIDLSQTWDTDPRRLQDTVANLTRSAQRLLPNVADDARIVLEDVVRRLDAGGDQLPSPVELASLQTAGEPDLGRRLLDGTALDHDGTGVSAVNKLWNVDMLMAGHNCGPWALAQLSARFGVSYPLSVTPSERGVLSRALFEAIGSRADFMTYQEVESLLSQLKPTRPGEPGPAALLVSSWVAGAGQGGHAYLAVYENGRVQLRDAFTGAPSRWPPYWGEGAVSRTAVGILNSDGTAVRSLDVGSNPLAAADEVGYVQGGPQDPDFVRRQEDYRAQDPSTREVDSSYAEPVGGVVDNSSDHARVDQLADDLSGVYGPYQVQLARVPDELTGVAGPILNGDRPIGGVYWSYRRDGDGNLVAFHGLIDIHDQSLRGQGFSRALSSQLEPYYERSGIDRIELAAAWQGAYAWASWGFSWDPDPLKLRESLDSIRQSARRLSATVNDDARAVLEDIIARLDPEHPRLPEPIDLARLTAPGHEALGRELLTNTNWHAVRYLDSAPAGVETRDDYRALNMLDREADTRFADPLGEVLDAIGSDGRVPDGAYQLAEDLSGKYGDFTVVYDGVSVTARPGVPPRLYLEGFILSEDGSQAGTIGRSFYRDTDGDLVVFNTEMFLEEWAQRQGFASAHFVEMDQYYRSSDVDRIEVQASFAGGYVWARLGFDWNPMEIEASLENVRIKAERLVDDPSTTEQARRALLEEMPRLSPDHPDPPTPHYLASLAADDTTDLGVTLMSGVEWSGVFWLREEG